MAKEAKPLPLRVSLDSLRTVYINQLPVVASLILTGSEDPMTPDQAASEALELVDAILNELEQSDMIEFD